MSQLKRCAILSMDNTEDFVIYDDLLLDPLAEAGWQCEVVSWRAKVDWNNYSMVVIRSPWDYQDHVDEFLTVLETIEHSSAQLENSLDIVKWNIDKRYLKELEDKGVAIVPTQWFDDFDSASVAKCFDYFNADELVIKPCISANADDTFWLKRDSFQDISNKLAQLFTRRPFMVQPFIRNIIEEGEYSLFYFSGEYSHAIMKTPKEGDFRVQEEHGGQLKAINPEDALNQAGLKVLAQIDQELLYARLDFVREQDQFLLIEAELIEPSLYFNLDDESPKRFVDAMERRLIL